MPISVKRIVHTIGKSIGGGESGGVSTTEYISILPLVSYAESEPTPRATAILTA